MYILNLTYTSHSLFSLIIVILSLSSYIFMIIIYLSSLSLFCLNYFIVV